MEFGHVLFAGHLYKMAQAELEGANSVEGVEATLLQVSTWEIK